MPPALAKEAAAAHTARYLADLEDHRKRRAEAEGAFVERVDTPME